MTARSVAACAVVAVLGLTACAGPSAPMPSSSAASANLALILHDAEADGRVSDAQRAAVRRATETGEVDFETYREAIDQTFACLTTAGLEYVGPRTDATMGFKVLEYSVVADWITSDDLVPTGPDVEVDTSNGGQDSEPDPGRALADACYFEHSAYIEEAYKAQPTSVALQDAFLEQQRESVIECAADAGIPLDNDLPIRQLLAQLVGFGEPGRQCLGDIHSF